MAHTPDTPPASSDEQNAHACRERCDERLAALRGIAARMDSPDTSFEELQELDEEAEPLEIEERRQLKILLSWGGPSDGFVLTFDKTGTDLIEGLYFHADWFTYAEQRLTFDEAKSVIRVYLHSNPTAYFQAA